MICWRQVWLLFSLLLSIQGLDKCPENVQTVDQLDAQKYLGYWYNTFGNANRVTEEGNRCIRATYKSYNATVIGVRNVAIKVGDTDWTQVCGHAWQPNPDSDPGKLVVQFHEGQQPPGDYWILGTDYDNYACIYSCFEFNEAANLYAWVLTRDPNPTLETVEQCLDIFIANGVDVSDFISFSQEDCDYDIIDSNSCEMK